MNGERVKPAAPAGASASPDGAQGGTSRALAWLGWGLVLAGLVLIAGFWIATATLTIRHARSLQSHLQVLEQMFQTDAGSMGQIDLESAGQHLAGMRQDLEAIQSRVGPLLPAGRWLRWAPKHGGDLAAAADLLDVATRLSVAGDRVLPALSPALEQVVGEWANPQPVMSVAERFLPLLAAAQPELRAARQELAAVRQVRDRIDAQDLSPGVAGYVQTLDRALPWFETAVDGALLAPSLLGADGPHTYLVLAQNNHELRATGGFISGVGELQVEGGRLTSLTFRDSYAVDNLKVPHELAPRDLQQTLFSELWLFRDTNWDVDFPLSARRAMEVYTRDQGVQVDGVVALDLMALQLLVEATGPIHVPGIPEPVTGETVLQVIQAQWTEPIAGVGQEQGEKWRLHRKDFMGQIAGAAVDQLMTGQDVPLVTLGRAAKKALDEKHILVYSTDSHAADLLRDRNWDGALEDSLSPSDRLLIVDSNVGFNKVDPNVDRSVGYRVDLTGGGVPTARLTLGYQHLSSRPVGACVQEARYGDTYAAMMERCYWNYVRVYVPGGSHLLAEPDLPLPAGSLLAKSGDAFLAPPIRPVLTDDRWAVWTAFFDLPTLGNVTLAFDYELPASVLDQGVDGLTRYHLSVQKQPGTEAVPLKVEIALPPGAELLDAAPAGLLSRQGAELVASTDLRIDREFEIVFRREGMKP